MNGFKTPSPRMAGFLSCGLFFLFAFSYIAPVLNVPWLKQPVEFDQALQQTLLVLLVGAFSYYIGATRSSDLKNETIATQANTIAAAAPAGSALATAKPTGTVDDPVAVATVDADDGFAKTRPQP
jgi:hypothetical protein